MSEYEQRVVRMRQRGLLYPYELIRMLTTACETAKSEIVGFQWLTHDVDYERFPQSLCVTWLFDSEASRRLVDSSTPAASAA